MFKNYRYLIVLAGLLVVPAVWALFVPGFYGASDDIHIAWLFEFHKALMMGQIPPRFVADLSFGFGYPLFNFAFPLPFYIAEIFHLSGLSLVNSIKMLFFVTIPLSGYFMYLLLKEYTNKSLSIAGALLYIYTPYRSVDLYVRGAIGEIVSFIFLPLILLSVIKISKTGSLRWVGIGAIVLAFQVMSHNITAYMFFPFLGLFILLQFIFLGRKWQFLAKTILMVFLAFLNSIYFWLPAIVDSSLMKYDTVFNFADHFPTLKQLVTPYWGYGASVPGPYDGISFFLGSVNLLVLGLGVFLLKIYWHKYSMDKKVILCWALISILITVFLMNYRSSIVWSNLPLLPYFQFPWRFLMLTTVTFPLLIIILESLGKSRLISIILVTLTLMTTASYFRPQDFLGRTDGYFLNRYIPTPLASEEYKKTQEEYLRLPKDTQIRPDRNYPRVTSDISIKKISLLNDLDADIQVEATKSAVINYNKYFFPGWGVKIDGKSENLKAGSPFGQITIEVPKGNHLLEVRFEETTSKKILDAVSLVAFLVSLMLAKLWIRSKKYGLS